MHSTQQADIFKSAKFSISYVVTCQKLAVFNEPLPGWRGITQRVRLCLCNKLLCLGMSEDQKLSSIDVKDIRQTCNQFQ